MSNVCVTDFCFPVTSERMASVLISQGLSNKHCANFSGKYCPKNVLCKPPESLPFSF